jgi:titin
MFTIKSIFDKLASRKRSSNHRKRQSPLRQRLLLESLEDRFMPSVFSVTSTADSGAGTLRTAIANANSTPGANSIVFSLPGSGVHTIALLSSLPGISNPVTLDGTTQPGYAGTPLVDLDGSQAGANVSGLTITGGNSTIKGLDISHFSANGILLYGPKGGNWIASDYLGTDPSGQLAWGNGQQGVFISNGSAGNLVGTNGDGSNDAAERNLIAGNGGAGVGIQGNGTNGNVVAGNYIGTDVTGSKALPNSNQGVAIYNGATGNRVGTNGTDADLTGERNVISGNKTQGVYISAANQNIVAGNYIGTDGTGTLALGNQQQGVLISSGAVANRVGSNGDGVGDGAEANVISGNVSQGVQISGTGTSQNVVAGNFIGTTASGTAALGNQLYGVLLYTGATSNLIGTNGTDADVAGERNVISGNVAGGLNIAASGTSQNTVAGNYIGTDATGNRALANLQSGVTIASAASNNLIGASGASAAADAAQRNVISGNAAQGIAITGSSSNWIAGNYLGTNASGTAALPNLNGIVVSGASASNRIGTNGTDADPAGERNVIAGNSQTGIDLTDSGTNANLVAGNFIGQAATGGTALANGSDGIVIQNGSQNNQIGGSAVLANVISFNTLAGIIVLDSGTTGNRIQANSIYSNGFLGIALNGDSITLNSPNNSATGPNNLQNYPLILTATPGSSTGVTGSFNSRPNGTYTLDFYASPNPDPRLFGEGYQWLGETTVTTDASGNASFAATLPVATTTSEWLAATATDAAGNTSEFSTARQLPATMVSLGANTWVPLGPDPTTLGHVAGQLPVTGHVEGLAADPTNPNVLYIAASGGGVWKTTNAQAAFPTWTPLTDNQATLATGAIALAPSNPSIVYAGTGVADNRFDSYYGLGVLKSTDGGASWTLLGQSTFNRLSISQIVVDPTNPNLVYVAVGGEATNGLPGNTGIYKSSDGGQTWTNTTASITTTAAFSSLVMDPTNHQILYAAAGSAYSDPADGIYKTTNAGASWTLLSHGIPTGLGNGYTKVAVGPVSNPQELFVAISTPVVLINNGQQANSSLYEMLKSSDGGQTWTVLPNVPNYLSYEGQYNSTLAVDPNNPNIVYAGGQHDPSIGFVMSTDGGTTWIGIQTGANGTNGPHSDHHAIGFDALGRLLDGDEGGIFRLDNANPATIQWTDLDGNLAISLNEGLGLHPTNPNLAVTGGMDNGTDLYQNGPGWTTMETGDYGWMAYDPANPMTIYQVAVNASVITGLGPTGLFQRSDDGGVTWTARVNGINPNDPTDAYEAAALDPNNPNRLLFGTNRVYESTDQGNTWTAISAPGSNGWAGSGVIQSVAFSPADPNTIWAAASGVIYVTFNNGASWNQVAVPKYFDQIAQVLPDSANNLMAYAVRPCFTGGPGGHVFETTNGGQSWTDISGNLPDLPVDAIALDPRSGTLYLGTDMGVYASDNGGATWQVFGTGLPNVHVSAVVLNPTDNLLAVATYGRGVWEIPTTRFAVATSTTPATSGTPFSLTVVAQDALGNPMPGYMGIVHFTSSAPAASLPADYTFTAADAGVHTFSVTLDTAGNQTVTVTDTVSSSLTASAVVAVAPAAATHLKVQASPSTVAGKAITITVTVLDAYNNIASSYLGTIHFTSSDANAALPANYTFTATDGGVHTFSAIILKSAGTRSITATDAATSTITGVASVTVSPGAATHLYLTAVSSGPSGLVFSVTVHALDAYNNLATGYRGTIHFTSTDPNATLPVDYTFTSTDGGVHTFTVTLATLATAKLTATDKTTGSITGSVAV